MMLAMRGWRGKGGIGDFPRAARFIGTKTGWIVNRHLLLLGKSQMALALALASYHCGYYMESATYHHSSSGE